MTRRALIVVLLSLGLLLAALVTRNGNMALMALPFLAYLGVGLLAAPSWEATHLRVTRSLSTNLAGASTTIQVSLAIRNEGRQMLALRLAEPLQPGMKITEGDLRGWLALAAGEETDFQYTFEALRGTFGWDTVATVVSDGFGLFESELDLPAGAGLQVQPRLKKFKPFPLRPDSTLHAPGSIPAGRGGSGTDFWGVREYHPGDALRHLDWRLAARHPRQFFTKEFEQEETADIALILDARQRVDVRAGVDRLFEHTLGATASLAEAFIHDGHRVSLLVLEDPLITVFPGYGKVQLNRILRTLARAGTAPDTSRLSLEFLPLRLFPSRCLLVILSPLTPDDRMIFPRLRAHGNQGLLICPDPIHFARQSFAADPATCLAVRAARLERRLQLRKIAQLQVRVIDWQVDQPLSPLVRAALSPARGRWV